MVNYIWQLCSNMLERTQAATRTFRRRVEAQILDFGEVADDFNFNLENKRILNEVALQSHVSQYRLTPPRHSGLHLVPEQAYEPDFDDNVKQDQSIDIYGRESEVDEDEVSRLANM